MQTLVFIVKYYKYQLVTINMRVKTIQEQTFADSFIDIPNSQLDTINKIVTWEAITTQLVHIKVDYYAC